MRTGTTRIWMAKGKKTRDELRLPFSTGAFRTYLMFFSAPGLLFFLLIAPSIIKQ